MVNYQNGKIYMLWSPSTDKKYIGSTTQPLCKRLVEHKKPTNRVLVTKLMFEKYNDIKIELIENCPCDNKEQLERREGQIIRETENCINKNIAGRTSKEYLEDNKEYFSEKAKEYREENKEIIKEKAKEYYENNKVMFSEKAKEYRENNKKYLSDLHKQYYVENKDNLLAKGKERYNKIKEKIKEKNCKKFECACGGKYTYGNKAIHFKTKMHINYERNTTKK